MKLVLMEFVSLDGVAQGPGGPDEDRTGGFERGGWFSPFVDQAFLDLVGEWIRQADAFLFGRRTYEAFARDWPGMNSADDPVGSRLNGLPKYVASNTLKAAEWGPASILSGDVPAHVVRLKDKPGRELQIHGSARLGYSLAKEGLIDEFRLAVAPVVVGQGRRLFPDGGPALGLELVDVKAMPGGLAVQTYRKSGAPAFATYGR